MPFRFLHSADLHLGRRFGALPEDLRGRLVEARHQILSTLAQSARTQNAPHILIAGDIFDTETPSDPVWRQALTAMAADPALHWWLIPGNHDSLAAESLWTRFRQHAPANVHLIDTAAPLTLAPGVTLLPSPLPRRYPGRDLTAWMPDCPTPPETLRIGLAHGAVRDFSEDGTADGIIPPDRAETAHLDYLALGDWHGHMALTPRTRYAGTPERDAFHHAGPGTCLAISLTTPGALPQIDVLPTGKFTWSDLALPLLPGQPADTALHTLLPAKDRRDHLIHLQATGRATLADQETLRTAAAGLAPEFALFQLDTTQLATEFEAADLDAIDRAGALRLAAEHLAQAAEDASRDATARRVSATALNRLYGYLHEDAK